MDTRFGTRVAHDADGLAGAFARPGVGLGALAAHRQAAKVANAAVALDALHPLEVHADLPAQIAFDDILAVLDRMNDLGELLLSQILRADGRVDLSVFENDLGVTRTDSVNVAQGDVDAFVRRNFYTNNTSHSKLNLVAVHPSPAAACGGHCCKSHE